MVKVESVHDPYILDYIEGTKIPALTRKNADFIEAIVRLDSNYAKDLIINPPEDGYDPEKNASNSNGKYCGSTAYWFDAMKNNSDFRDCLLGTIIAIDSVNSTHLEACVNGRKHMRDIIFSKCKNYRELIQLLEQNYSPSNHNHLIALLTASVKAKNKNSNRYNLSFATKFCSYAVKFLDSNVEYSKYDNVVSDALPIYSKIYLGIERNKLDFKISNYRQKSLTESEKYQYRLDVFNDYAKCINAIIASLKNDRIQINKDEFDHIVWYGFKG